MGLSQFFPALANTWKKLQIFNLGLRLKEQTALGTPDAGFLNIYFDSADSKLKIKDENGTVKILSDALTSVAVSDITDLTATATELNYVDGVTSDIQTQINNAKLTFVKVVKNADESRASTTTKSADTDLIANLQANKSYHFMILAFIYSRADTDFKYAFSVPSGASGYLRNSSNWNPLSPNGTIVFVNDIIFPTSGIAHDPLEIHGVINTTVAGVFSFNWAQNVTNVDATRVLKGSMLLVWEE